MYQVSSQINTKTTTPSNVPGAANNVLRPAPQVSNPVGSALGASANAGALAGNPSQMSPINMSVAPASSLAPPPPQMTWSTQALSSQANVAKDAATKNKNYIANTPIPDPFKDVKTPTGTSDIPTGTTKAPPTTPATPVTPQNAVSGVGPTVSASALMAGTVDANGNPIASAPGSNISSSPTDLENAKQKAMDDAALQLQNAEQNNFTQAEKDRITQAATAAGAQYDALIADAKKKAGMGEASALVTAGQQGGLINSQFSGNAAFDPKSASENFFFGRGGALEGIRSNYDADIQNLESQKNAAIQNATMAEQEAVRTGNSKLYDVAAQQYQAAVDAHNQQISRAQAASQQIQSLQSEVTPGHTIVQRDPVTGEIKPVYTAPSTVNASNIGNYAASLIQTDAEGKPVAPTQQQIDQLAQSTGIDPAIIQGAVNQQIQKASKISGGQLGEYQTYQKQELAAGRQPMGIMDYQAAVANEKNSSKISDYNFYAQQERANGRVPMGFNDFKNQGKTPNPLDVQLKQARLANYKNVQAQRDTNIAAKVLNENGFNKDPTIKMYLGADPLLAKVKSALDTNGPVADQELLDAVTMMNTGGSRVTESQVGIILQGQSYDDWLARTQQKIASGGILSPENKAQLKEIAGKTYNALQDNYQKRIKVYQDFATQNGLKMPILDITSQKKAFAAANTPSILSSDMMNKVAEAQDSGALPEEILGSISSNDPAMSAEIQDALDSGNDPTDILNYLQGIQPDQGSGFNSVGGDTNQASDVGALSQKFESGGNPASIGYDSTGGYSYGKYQFAHNTAENFINQSPYKDDFKGLTFSSRGWQNKWKELAKKNPDEFGQAQEDYAQKQYLQPLAAKAAQAGIDISQRSPVLAQVIFSTAIQHGANTDVIDKAIAKAGPDATDEELIKAIYDERWSNGERFGSSTPAVQNAVKNRFFGPQGELATALSQLNDTYAA